MIKTWQHKGLRRFFEHGSTAGIRADHAQKLARQLRQLNDARAPQDMNIPGWDLHKLQGNLKGCWAVKVNGNWRLTFRFEGGDAELVDYQDYH
jgi:proteic killer suppression protein